MDTEQKTVKVGSRKSELALIQTHYVISILKKLYPEKEFEIVTMSTLGDRILNISLPKIGEKSLFTKDLEEALENGSVDMVVHSLKDLPTTLPTGMAIGAVLEREDPRDALVLREDFKGHTLATLPSGSIIGTSSLRRTAQLSRLHHHLKVVDIRGNLNTRLKKLDYHCKTNTEINKGNGINGSGEVNGSKNVDDNNSNSNYCNIPEYAAIILAQAGLVRMGWHQRISQVLSNDEMLYAVGQGALAIECKASNQMILEMLAPLNHEDTYCRILSERSFLKTLGGGCSAPVAVSTFLDFEENSTMPKKKLEITGAVWSLNGDTKVENSLSYVFDSLVLEKESCKYNLNEIKEKSLKHKIDDHEKHTEETSESVQPKKLCSVKDNIDINNKSIPCCKRNTLNMTMGRVEPIEIENLINIHGKLFLSCPFSDTKGGVCPVRLPVGEEFMGKCPYLSKDDDSLLETKDAINEQLVKLHPRKLSYDIKKCPFMSNQIIALDAQLRLNVLDETKGLPTYDIDKEPKAKNCPFLKQKELQNCNKKSECVESLQERKSEETNIENEQTSSNSAVLYCGLTKHMNISQHIIEKCEDLGKKLAQSLINRGALEIMKCAQDHIRSTAPPTLIMSTS